MFKKNYTHPKFGRFERFLGPWKGKVNVGGWDEALELIVEVKSEAELIDILNNSSILIDHPIKIREEIEKNTYEDYQFFKKMDIEEAGMDKSEFEDFPQVTKQSEIYPACRPYSLRLGNRIGEYEGNSYILFDVLWPNDHGMQLFFDIGEGTFCYRHVELFG